jgi:hypothetical protein
LRVAPARRKEKAVGITLVSDTARFRPDDPDELVEASLACPLCLRSDEVVWEAAFGDGWDPSVECRCPSCDERWRVYLDPFQTLRLSVLHH